jgi:two-component system response regulator MprA
MNLESESVIQAGTHTGDDPINTRIAHRIVVADDDRNLRALIEDLLTEAGYEVATASDGVEALAAVEQAVPALMLLDMRMPRMDGLTVLDHLRQSGRTFPVVVITAQPDAGEAALARGAVRVLLKPVSLDVLLDAVQSAVA